MDSIRGNFDDHSSATFGASDHDAHDDGFGHEAPPAMIGQDERRMQVRAYNFWASMLDNRQFPSIEDLDPTQLPDFGPHSVLLDFTAGIENPAIQFLGAELARECGTDHEIRYLSDVPSRSLLSRITDHYMQILANQSPIGFEAEFVNQRGCTILYRGILLPFSSDDETIDFIYGVINWKELADQRTTDELLLQIDQALEARPAAAASASAAATAALTLPAASEPLTGWADGPADSASGNHAELDDVLELVTPLVEAGDGIAWPTPAFGAAAPSANFAAEIAVPGSDDSPNAYFDLNDLDEIAPPLPTAALPDADSMELADWLASAREMAQAAQGSEDRSRGALYGAISRAYDFSIAAAQSPDDFTELLVDSGLTMQDRAPMTPVVKLVFGADYDKTRITEYATALSHAHRISLGRGRLASFLSSAPGGLKGVVNTERQLKREESGKAKDQRDTPREALARKLRKLDHHPLADIAVDGSEFTLLVARRMASGEVVVLGEVDDDVPLLERVARKLLN